MNRMSGYAAHLSHDLKTGIRDKSLMLMTYLFPIGFFLMVGMFMPALNPGFLDIMIPGMIVFAVMSATLLTIPFTLVGGRETGVFRSFRVNGVPAGALITIPVVGCLIHTAAVAAILTVGGALLYGARLPTNWGWFALVFLLTSACFATLGVLIGIVAQSTRSGTLLAQAVYLPSVMLGGLMVPEEMLPEGLRTAASLLPATNSMRGFTALALDGTWSATHVWPLLILAAGILVNVVLCFVLFQWDTRPARPRLRLLALLAVVPFAAGMVIM